MPTHVAPRRDFHGLEVRRKQAARLFATGRETQGAIARRLGVSRQSVMRWYQAWRSGGRGALRAPGRGGGRKECPRQGAECRSTSPRDEADQPLLSNPQRQRPLRYRETEPPPQVLRADPP